MRLTAIAAAAAIMAGAAGCAPVAAQTFIGPRVEATIAFDRLSGESDRSNYAGAPSALSGVRFGAGVGYDVALGSRIVLGIEASAGSSRGHVTALLPQATRVRLGFGRDLDVMLRMGARLGHRTLVYGKAGYASSRYAFRYASAATGFSFRGDGVADGWRVGVGIERAIGPRSYLKGEYRHTGYRDEAYSGNSRQQVLLGAGLRF